MEIKLSISVLLKITNLEAYTYYYIGLLGKVDKDEPKRLQTATKKLLAMNAIEVVTDNVYKIADFKEPYVIVDETLNNTEVRNTVKGGMIRLKCWSRINSNYVDLTINRITHETRIENEITYDAIRANLIKSTSGIGIKFVHPSLCHISPSFSNKPIKISIPALLKLSNNEAIALFCTILCIREGTVIADDIIRKSTFSESTVYSYLNRFDSLGLINIERTGKANGYGNKYIYNEPESEYISVDESLLDIDLDRIELGALLRLKCWSRIASNTVELSLNRIVHELGIDSDRIYQSINKGILQCIGTKKHLFKFIHKALLFE